MQIVIDSTVWVSALVFGGNPRKVFERVVGEGHTLVISQEILSETRIVTGKQFPSHEVSQSRCFPVTMFPSHEIVTGNLFPSHDRVGGISCVAVKCVDIGRNTSGEGDHLD